MGIYKNDSFHEWLTCERWVNKAV